MLRQTKHALVFGQGELAGTPHDAPTQLTRAEMHISEIPLIPAPIAIGGEHTSLSRRPDFDWSMLGL